MKFTLEITLGNDAMQTVDDVSKVLGQLCEDYAGNYDEPVEEETAIRDRNGNRVGVIRFTEAA